MELGKSSELESPELEDPQIVDIIGWIGLRDAALLSSQIDGEKAWLIGDDDEIDDEDPDPTEEEKNVEEALAA